MISPTSTGSVALSLQWPTVGWSSPGEAVAPPRTRGPVGARVALLRRPLGALLGALVVAHADVVVAADRVQKFAADAAHGGLDAVRPQVGDDPDVRRRRGDGGEVDARLAVRVEREPHAREARLVGLGPRAEPLRRARARREARRGLHGADLAHGFHEGELEVRLAGRDVVLAAPLARDDLLGDVHERRLEQVRDPRRPAPRQLEEPSATRWAARRDKKGRGAARMTRDGVRRRETAVRRGLSPPWCFDDPSRRASSLASTPSAHDDATRSVASTARRATIVASSWAAYTRTAPGAASKLIDKGKLRQNLVAKV